MRKSRQELINLIDEFKHRIDFLRSEREILEAGSKRMLENSRRISRLREDIYTYAHLAKFTQSSLLKLIEGGYA